jgi:hypothetical protein
LTVFDRRKEWQGRRVVKVDAERLYTIQAASLVPSLRIPSFQRGYVWSAADAVALLDSIATGYPIGAITLWDPEDRGWGLSSERLIVLDGQQRLTTLAGALLPGATVGQVPRVVYDVEADRFAAAGGTLTDDQVSIADMGDAHAMGEFWRNQASRRPQSWCPRLTAEAAKERDRRLWSEIAPGVPFPKNQRERRSQADAMHQLQAAIQSSEAQRMSDWTASNPGAGDWIVRMETIWNQIRDHQTSVTVVRGGTIDDVREVFRRLNTAGRPLDEDGIRTLLATPVEG